MEIREYYNLDSSVKSFFTNTRVLNALAKNNIETLWDLYCVNENILCKGNSLGEISRRIIHEAYQYFEYLYNLNFNYVEIYAILKPYLKRKVLVSVNSDNQYLSEIITVEKLLWIANNERLSDKDRININAVINYLKDNLIKVNTDETTFLILKSMEVFVDKNPFDTISPTIARFNDDKEAYDKLIEIIKSFGHPKSDMYMMYHGIFQKRNTLETIGQKYNLTRERVRQLNVKLNNKIFEKLDCIKYKVINYFQKEYYIPFENPLLLIYCEYLRDRGYYSKSKILDEDIYILPTYKNELHNRISEVEKEIEDTGLYQFDESDINAKVIQKLLSKKYKINDGIVYGKNTLVSSIPKVMEEIGKSINLNSENDINLVYSILESKYGVKSNYHDARNLERVLAGTCVLLDNRTYIHERYISKLDNIEDIFKYIEDSKITNAQKIFEEYKQLWESIEIYSHIGVYGYMKYFYPQKYNYGGRSFLISVIGENSAWGSEVIDRIKEFNRPVTFNEMNRDYPALSETIWINLENIFTDLILWGDNSYYCISSLELPEQKKNKITKFMFDNKIVFDKELFMFIFETDKDLLEMYNISNEKQLQKLININLGDVIHFNSSNSSFYI